MNYSIIPVLHSYANSKGAHKINIQVIYQRKKVYAPTKYKVQANQWENGNVVNHPNKKQLNQLLGTQKNKIEERLLEALRRNENISKEELSSIAKGNGAFTGVVEDYIDGLIVSLKGNLSDGRLKHYNTIAVKINDFAPGVTFGAINVKWLQGFESWLRKQPGRNGLMDGNTVQSKMSLLKGVLNRAKVAGMIERNQYEEYKVPGYSQKLPSYWNEADMEKFYNFLQGVGKPTHKLAGYYFLLGCYAGYRLANLLSFNYDEMVKGEDIVLRTIKNETIVSTFIHTRLKKVLDYIQDKPLTITEQKFREYIKELAGMCGLSGRTKIHDSRHSFAMMLMKNGFTKDEVAHLIGDTLLVTKVYARIENPDLSLKIKNRLG